MIIVSAIFFMAQFVLAGTNIKVTGIDYIDTYGISADFLNNSLISRIPGYPRMAISQTNVVASNILDIYMQEGFDDSVVSITVKNQGIPSKSILKKAESGPGGDWTQKARIEFKLDEGIREKIREVVWISTDNIILKEEKTSGFLTPTLNRKSLQDKIILHVKEKKNRGYYDYTVIKISDILKKKTVKLKTLRTIIIVSPGERWRMGRYRFLDPGWDPKKTVLDLHPGKYFNLELLQKDIRSIGESYRLKGYPCVTVTTNLTKENGAITVDISVSDKSTGRFEGMRITGLSRTKPWVLNALVPFRAGDLFSEKKRETFESQLNSTGFFRDVSVFMTRTNADGFLLHADLKEQQTGLITIGATVASGPGLGGYIDVREMNFMGRGVKLMAHVEWQTFLKQYSCGVVLPPLTNMPFSVSFMPYFANQRFTNAFSPSASDQIPSFTLERAGLIAGLIYRTGFIHRIGVLNRFEHKEYFGSESPIPVRSPLYYRDSVFMFYRQNSLNHYYLPTKGNLITGSVEMSFGQNRASTYLKLKVEAEKIFPITGWSSFIAHGMMGMIVENPFLPAGAISSDDMFWIYQGEDLRGFAMDSGPGAQTGLGKLVCNLEYRLKIVKILEPYVFLDIGNLWDYASQMNLAFGQYPCSAGIGIRLSILMLPLNFSYGYRLQSKPGWSNHEGWGFDFSVGMLFGFSDSGSPSFESLIDGRL